MPSPLRLILLTLSAGAIAALVLLGCSADEAGDPSSRDGRSSSVAGAAGPTLPPPDLKLGRDFERNGQYDEALAVYDSVIKQGRDA
jgi:hypothetical protein